MKLLTSKDRPSHQTSTIALVVFVGILFLIYQWSAMSGAEGAYRLIDSFQYGAGRGVGAIIGGAFGAYIPLIIGVILYKHWEGVALAVVSALTLLGAIF